MTARGRRLASRVCGLLAILLLGAPVGAAGQATPEPFAPYDGSNPFKCELQDVGIGTNFPDPGADPFCVKFDKTNQNLTDFGLVEFLAQEPARLAAAAPKCFYYQRDEWTGSVVQGEEPELWHWLGGYFFDKARGLGGVSVRQFRVGGVPFSAAPFAPPDFAPYFDEAGGGGGQIQYATNPGFGCEAMVDTPEERGEIIRDESVLSECVEPGGRIRARRVGSVALGSTRESVHRRLGDPVASKGRADTWCVTGGDYLQVIFRGKPARAALIRTTVVGQSVDGVGAGTSSERAQRRLGLERLFRVGGTRVLAADDRPRLLVGVSGSKVRWLALFDPKTFAATGSLKRAIGAAL